MLGKYLWDQFTSIPSLFECHILHTSSGACPRWQLLAMTTNDRLSGLTLMELRTVEKERERVLGSGPHGPNSMNTFLLVVFNHFDTDRVFKEPFPPPLSTLIDQLSVGPTIPALFA